MNNHSSTVLQKENYNSLETNFKVMENCDLNDREFKIAVIKKLNMIQKTQKKGTQQFHFWEYILRIPKH